MGAFFANIQILAQPGQTADGILAALARHYATQGYAPAPPANATLALHAALPEDGGWCSVYSSTLERQPLAATAEMVRQWAAALHTCCVGITVHDSDALFVQMADARTGQSDTLALGVAGGPEALPGGASAPRGDEAAWAGLLAEDATPATLRQLWDKEQLFAEDTVPELAMALGMSPWHAATGWRYLQQEDDVEYESLYLARKPS